MINKKTWIFGMILLILFTFNVIAYKTDTHKHLTGEGIKLYLSGPKNSYTNLIEEYRDYIIQGSELEDEEVGSFVGEMPQGYCPGEGGLSTVLKLDRHPYCNHFWDGGDRSFVHKHLIQISGNIETTTWLTAEERAKGIYEQAVKAYKNRDYEKAFLYLGRVAHIVQDMSVPAHTQIVDHSAYDSYEHYMGKEINYNDYNFRSVLYYNDDSGRKVNNVGDILKRLVDKSTYYPVMAIPIKYSFQKVDETD